MVEVKFYDEVDDNLLKFAVIIAKTNNRWVFCKHRERDTYEETGALEYSIKPVCVYSVTAPDNFDGKESFGMLYVADILSFENELHSEIEKILITEQLVENWTYPLIQPKLIEEARRRRYL